MERCESGREIRNPGFIPLLLNHPIFISSAKWTGLFAQCLVLVLGIISRMLTISPLLSRKATLNGMLVPLMSPDSPEWRLRRLSESSKTCNRARYDRNDRPPRCRDGFRLDCQSLADARDSARGLRTLAQCATLDQYLNRDLPTAC